MPAINFQKKFAADIESGKKRQIIQLIRKRPIRAGNLLYLYTGMRTKSCRKLKEVWCESAEPIVIEDLHIFVGVYQLSLGEKYNLAIADGFSSIGEFRLFFEQRYGLPFHGYLIKW